MKKRELERRLLACGWRFLRHGSRHDVWTDGEGEEYVPRHAEVNETAGPGNSAKGVQGTDMRFAGKLVRDGRWWLAEIPMLDALTQGRTRREALEMVKDWLETAVNRSDFHATVHEKGRAEFEVSGSDATSLIALLLRRRRAASGASLRDMATRLGATSRNAYARYERGEAAPTLEKLDALLKATSPGGDFVIRETQ